MEPASASVPKAPSSTAPAPTARPTKCGMEPSAYSGAEEAGPGIPPPALASAPPPSSGMATPASPAPADKYGTQPPASAPAQTPPKSGMGTLAKPPNAEPTKSSTP